MCARRVRPGKVWRQRAVLNSNLDRCQEGLGQGRAVCVEGNLGGCERCRKNETTGFGDWSTVMREKEMLDQTSKVTQVSSPSDGIIMMTLLEQSKWPCVHGGLRWQQDIQMETSRGCWKWRQRAEQNVCASERKNWGKSSYKANKEELVRGGSLGPPLQLQSSLAPVCQILTCCQPAAGLSPSWPDRLQKFSFSL